MTFRAIRVVKDDTGQKTELVSFNETDLMEGDVTIAVDYSTVNYKDAVALSGRSPFIKTFPLILGIDLAGTVETSTNEEFKAGDKVVLNGWELGETHHGGFAQKARVKGDWLVKLPPGLTTRQAMAIGTAGYTAMLSVLALEHEGVTPDKGDVLVTGAGGGVGSVAIALLSKLGYRVLASTGRPEEADHVKALGAADHINRNTLSEPGPPLGKERWAGAIDVVGSHTLVNVLAQTRYGGTVTSCGFVQGLDLPGSVLPFILHDITLAGIDSVRAPKAKRLAAWARLARDLDLGKLEHSTSVIALDEAPDVAQRMLAGQVRGRTLVDVNALGKTTSKGEQQMSVIETHETAPTRFIEANGIRYAYRRFGKESGVPLVFLQHFRGTMDNWDPMITNGFAQDRPVVLFDNAGVGLSGSETPDNVADMARHAVAFIEALGLTQVDLLGFSLGGFVAQQVTLGHPDLVRRVVLAGTGPQGGEGMDRFTPAVEAVATKEKSGPESLLFLFFEPTATSQAAGRTFLQRLGARTTDREEPSSLQTRDAQLKAIQAWGVPEGERYSRLKQIRQPVFVANGTNDIMVPTVNSFILSQRLPNAYLILYPDSGHGFLFQYAGLFVEHVSRFLRD